MEFKEQFMEAKCIKWKIALPHVHKNKTSPVFILQNTEMYVKLYGSINIISGGSFQQNSSVENWRIKLEPITDFKVGVVSYIENGNGELLLIGMKLTDIYTVTEFTRNELLSYGVMEDDVSFVFVFHYNCSYDILKDAAFATSSRNLILEGASTGTGLQSLSDDIEKLLDKAEHSDVVLMCSNKSFPANRNILSARSEVFAAMFRHKMLESESGQVNIKDINPTIFEKFLRYIYSGRLDDLSIESAFDLYKVGDKYSVPLLKRNCLTFLVDNMTENNACEILTLADTFGDAELLNSATAFVVKREQFLKSDRWMAFTESHPSVAMKVFVSFFKK